MDLLIRNARVSDPNSPHHGQTVDLHIVNGTISSIGNQLEAGPNTTVVESNQLEVSPGWFDLHVNFGDPGFEYREDLTSGPAAAAAGGFTEVALMPATNPPIDTKSGVEYVISKTANHTVTVHPVGCVSEKREGNDIAELYDMQQAGAIAFSDDKRSLNNAELLKRALLYTQPFNGLVMSFPNDEHIAHNGQMNEGETSTALGLRGLPALAEELMVARDLFLLEYTGGRLHFQTISTAKSVALIRAAKAQGLNVTAEVAVHNLVLTDTELMGFDSNYKVLPPLRTETDRQALITGVKDGTIDAIVSDHRPYEQERKDCEFDNAAFGIIGLETMFALLNTHLADSLSPDQILAAITHGPRAILGVDSPVIAEGNPANITCFDRTIRWTPTASERQSRASNSPFFAKELTGRAIAIVNNGRKA